MRIVANIVLVFLLALAAACVGYMTSPFSRIVPLLCCFLLLASAGFCFVRRWKGGALALFLTAVCFFSHLGAYLPLFFTLSIEGPATVAAGSPVPVLVTMKTYFFTSTFGCASKRAFDAGKFIPEIPDGGTSRTLPATEAFDRRDWPKGSLYDPGMFRRGMFKMVDGDGANVPPKPVEDNDCRIPYTIWPDVTIKEIIDIGTQFDIARPGIYRIQAVMSLARSNVLSLKVTP